MAKIKNIEKRIWDTEGFAVVIKKDDKDVRGDKVLPAHYPVYERRSNDDSTVTDWKRTRFSPSFPGYEVSVVDAEDNVVAGNTKLKTVRETYLEE